MSNHAGIISCPACVVGVLALLLSAPVAASTLCPTKEEAREKYEDARIYWHSDMHCWDNRRTNSRDWPHVEEKPKAAKGLDVWTDPKTEETIWPNPPEKFDTSLMETTGAIHPLRWWNELIEFGNTRVRQ